MNLIKYFLDSNQFAKHFPLSNSTIQQMQIDGDVL